MNNNIVTEADVEVYINQLNAEEERRKLEAALEQERQRAEQERVERVKELQAIAANHPHLWLDDEGYLQAIPATEFNNTEYKVKQTPRTKLLSSPVYIRTAANNPITHQMYTIEYDPDDIWLDAGYKVYKPFYRVHLLDENEIFVKDLPYPERYTNKNYLDFVERATLAHHAEVIVQTKLEQAGVCSRLLATVLDGDTSSPNIDILLQSPTVNADGKYTLAGYDVKAHYHTHFTNSPSSFPKSLRVDFTHAIERKSDTCAKLGYPFKGTIHYSVPGGGLLVILNSTREKWGIEMNYWDGKEREQYVAGRDCMFPFAKLVQHYTRVNNT